MGYRVEWFESDTVRHEVQAVRLTWESGDQPSGEFFRLAFKGESALADMDPDVSYVNLRDALMNINNANDDFLVGHIDVERSTINGDEGYVYTIVFEDTGTNAGDQPMLTPIGAFSGTGSIRVYEVTSGIRAGGAPEVQKISIGGSGGGTVPTGASDENPDEAVVRGYWRAQFAASNFRWVTGVNQPCSCSEACHCGWCCTRVVILNVCAPRQPFLALILLLTALMFRA